MKKRVTGYIILLLISLTLAASTCYKNPSPPFPTIIGFWDYTGFSKVMIDSTGANGYNEQLYDTGFATHSQNSYQFKADSTFIYIDYTITPNLIKTGTYSWFYTGFTNLGGTNGGLILEFPSGNPDTLHFNLYLNDLQFINQTDSMHILTQQIKNYTTY